MKNKINNWFLKIKKYFKKADKKIVIFLLFLMILAGLVRGYNFKEWLLVRADQVRDSNMAREFLENGVGSLRLLGPKITKVVLPGDGSQGETLHMGPYYYYVQAVSMKIFNNPSPWTIAIPDLILSILAIPLFYLVISKIFSVKTSLITTTLFSFSFLVIQYSRFSWNPNQLIFWQLLFISCLLKFLFEKNNNGNWMVGVFLSLIIVSQLHFLSLVGTSFVFVLFFVYQKSWRKLKLKHYIASFLLLIFFYIPVIVSDIKNDGNNYKRLIASVYQQKSDNSFKKNTLETIEKSARFYFYFPFPVTEEEFESIHSAQFSYLALSLIFISLIFFNKTKFLNSVSSKKNRTLAFIILIYFGAFFLIDIGIADRLEKPRYWLSIAPVSFLILAFWLEFIIKMKKSFWLTLMLFSIISFSFLENIYSVYYWYASLNDGIKRELPFKDPILRPHRELITLGEIERVSDYMSRQAIKNNKNICYFSADYQTKNSFKYVLSYKHKNLLVKRLDDLTESSEDCVIFIMTRSDQKIQEIKDDLPDRFNFNKVYRDGAIVLWELEIKKDKDFPKRGLGIFENNQNETKIDLWKDVFCK